MMLCSDRYQQRYVCPLCCAIVSINLLPALLAIEDVAFALNPRKQTRMECNAPTGAVADSGLHYPSDFGVFLYLDFVAP